MSTDEPQQSARDRFIDVLRSRGMLKPGEEWVIDANLNAFAHELAERQRGFAEGTLKPFGEEEQAAVLAAADLIDPEKP